MTHILALTSLVKAVVGFRYPKAKEERLALKTTSFDNYLNELGRGLPKLPNLKILEPLRNLTSVLRRSSLLVLNPLGLESKTCRGYGIGPKGTQVGHILMPLWYPERQQHFNDAFMHPGERVTATKTMTTLAVAPTGEECFQHSSTSSDREARRGVPKAKVVGPAICVFPRALLGDIQQTNVQWVNSSSLDKSQFCFTCLV